MEVSWWQVFLACAGLVVSICSLQGGLLFWQSSRLAKQIQDAEARIRAEQQASEARMRSERQASETRIMERFRSLEEGNRAEH